jgi:DNA-binding NarL/FixJ family response regulator
MQLGLEPDVEVVGEARDGAEALELARRLHPDIVVMDAQMPGLDGMAATQTLRRVVPRAAVVMLSMHDSTEARQRAQAAGACAFVGKCESPAALLAAIRQAMATRLG